MSATALFRPTFTDLRSEIERRVSGDSPPDEIGSLIDQFLAAGGETPAPIVEYDGTVTWIYRDAQAETVAVVGDIIGFDPRTTRMARLPGCDLFYMTAQLPHDAHIAYAFAVDNPPPEGDDPAAWAGWLARCRPDPLNPQQITGPGLLKVASVLTMPGAQVPTELPDHDPATVANVAMHQVGSPTTGVWRRVWVSLPPDYNPRRTYPTSYFLEGEGYLMAARTPEIVELMAFQRQIEPGILVFVEGLVERGVEALTRYLSEALLPWIESRYAARADAEGRVICGASAGGAASLAVALSRPDLFGGAIAQSPSPDLAPNLAQALLARAAARGWNLPRCYVDVGRYESPAMIEYAQGLCSALIEGGAAVAYQEFPGDHSFLGWRATLPDALRFHFGAASLDEL